MRRSRYRRPLLSAIILGAVIVGVALLGRHSTFKPHTLAWHDKDYSVEDVVSDLELLGKLYPDFVEWSVADRTSQRRPIPLAMLGSPEAPRCVMIQASMHAREYMSSRIVMALVELYAHAARSHTKIEGYDIAQLLRRVRFVILPMVNPDGVAVSQQGLGAEIDRRERTWVASMVVDSGYDHRQIKSNAHGVDLNRNFTNGFGMARNVRSTPDFYHFPGSEPLSEVESRLMLSVAERFAPEFYINYHTSGNLIYWGCANASESVNEQAETLAMLAGEVTDYPQYGPDSAPENGSWADEVEVRFGRPSITIELGTRNPVPEDEFGALFRRNRAVWAATAHR